MREKGLHFLHERTPLHSVREIWMEKYRLNPQVASWLNAGAMQEALLGQGDFFIADHTYRSEHDLVLVMNTLLHWTKQHDALSQTSDNLTAICQELANKADFMVLRDIILSYDICSKDQNITLGFNIEEWYRLLPQELKWNKTEPII